MSKIKLVFLMIIVNSLSSCLNDERKMCTLATRTDFDRSGRSSTITTFLRNGENSISGINTSVSTSSFGYTINYVRDNSGNIISDDTGGIYTYDNKNRIIEQRKPYSGEYFPGIQSNLIYVIRYEYNDVGQMVTAKYYELYVTNFNQFTTGIYPIQMTVTYTYNDNSTKNPSIVKYFAANGHLLNTATFEYDDRPNPEKGLFPSIEVDNNVTRELNDFETSPNEITYSYQYNSSGFVIQRTSSYFRLRKYTYSFCE